jgi:ribosomal protein S7
VVKTEAKDSSVEQLINKILNSIDSSKRLTIKKIDPDSFNFIKNSTLSIDEEENEN